MLTVGCNYSAQLSVNRCFRFSIFGGLIYRGVSALAGDSAPDVVRPIPSDSTLVPWSSDVNREAQIADGPIPRLAAISHGVGRSSATNRSIDMRTGPQVVKHVRPRL